MPCTPRPTTWSVQDAPALAEYLAGRSGPDERLRALLDAENRTRQWLMAMSPTADSADVLYGHGVLAWCARERQCLRAPRMSWTGSGTLSA